MTAYMQLYVGDYLRDTQDLTAEQHGAYLLLLMTMWSKGGSLPNDPKKLARIARCTPSRWGKIADDVLAFFEVGPDSITHGRLAGELEIAREKSIKRAEAGSKGGRAKALKDKKAQVAIAMPLPCHSPEPEPEEVRELTLPVVLPSNPKPEPWASDEGFSALWSAATKTMTSRGPKRLAWPEWRKALRTYQPEQIIAAMKRYVAEDPDVKAGRGQPAVHRWLKDGRHEGWMRHTQPAKPMTENGWRAALQVWADDHEWLAQWGPKPGEPGCRVPANLLHGAAA